MNRSGRAPFLVAVALAELGMWLIPGRLRAQLVNETRWTLEGGRGGFCIWYLADPTLAQALVSEKTALAPAGTGSGLPPSLVRVIHDEPQFEKWIPATICVGAFATATVDGKVVARGRPDRPVVVATSSMAAQAPLGVVAAGHLLLSLATDQHGLELRATDAGFDLDRVQVTFKPNPNSG